MESLWSKTCERRKRPALKSDIRADVAVIGAGMAGILAAWQLEQSGVRAVVLEAGRLGGGQTENTTAKITSQHGMFCRELIRKKGKEQARKYVQANQDAVEEYKRIVRREKIDCDFQEQDACVYSFCRENAKQEAEAARSLGVDAVFEEQAGIPLPCAGAVRFPGQAQFHPLKFIQALADGLAVYENTPVTEVEENLVKTPWGSVQAENILFAAHFPFVNVPGLYFARMYQERSYVLALEGAGSVDAMYIGEGKETLSFRQYGRYLLLGGEGHRTGENRQGGCYERLKEQAQRLYPESRAVACWSAQDCMTGDGIPFIGVYAKSRPHWLVATGFGKWGMTSAMVSAMLLRDRICGRENPYAEVFSPSRFSLEELLQVAKNGAWAVKGLGKRLFCFPGKTDAGLSLACPHMGCRLEWNPDGHSWDCPCHGSRFDGEGNLLDGPAREGMGYE